MKSAFLTLVAGLAALGVAQAQSYSTGKAGAEKARSESGETLLRKFGCSECHARQTNLAAPALLTISAKYQGNLDAVSIIIATVRNGRHGREVLTMPPHPNVSEADAKTIANYILTLKKR